jgi:S1-C subfamily serine protease
MMKYILLAALALLLASCSKMPLNNSIFMLRNTFAACTGFNVEAPSGKTYLLTAGHCAMLADSGGSIKTIKEDGTTVMSRIIAVSPDLDLLLLDPVPGLRGFKVAPKDYPGERIRVIGHGYALPLWEVDGDIIGDAGMVLWLETLTSAPAAPGHSGSPVIDPYGHVVGVLSTSNGVISGFVRLQDLQSFLKGY